MLLLRVYRLVSCRHRIVGRQALEHGLLDEDGLAFPDDLVLELHDEAVPGNERDALMFLWREVGPGDILLADPLFPTGIDDHHRLRRVPRPWGPGPGRRRIPRRRWTLL